MLAAGGCMVTTPRIFDRSSRVYEAKFTSVDDTSPAISVLIDISQNQDAGVLFRLYRISTDDLNGGRHVIEEGTSLPDRFHVKAEVPGLPFPALSSPTTWNCRCT